MTVNIDISSNALDMDATHSKAKKAKINGNELLQRIDKISAMLASGSHKEEQGRRGTCCELQFQQCVPK